MEDALDAFLYPIVVGGDYAYYVENNGITEIIKCRAESITPKGYVSVSVKERTTQYGVKGKRTTYINREKFPKTSVKPIKLFPLC